MGRENRNGKDRRPKARSEQKGEYSQKRLAIYLSFFFFFFSHLSLTCGLVSPLSQHCATITIHHQHQIPSETFLDAQSVLAFIS